jgi:hypothetical protein
MAMNEEIDTVDRWLAGQGLEGLLMVQSYEDKIQRAPLVLTLWKNKASGRLGVGVYEIGEEGRRVVYTNPGKRIPASLVEACDQLAAEVDRLFKRTDLHTCVRDIHAAHMFEICNY